MFGVNFLFYVNKYSIDWFDWFGICFFDIDLIFYLKLLNFEQLFKEIRNM